jgi:hypothetical protein
MMIRKAALVGCKEGPWVAIHGLVEPRLRAQGAERFGVEHSNGKKFEVPAGSIHIGEGTFVRITVLEGDPEQALCDIISGGRRAICGS